MLSSELTDLYHPVPSIESRLPGSVQHTHSTCYILKRIYTRFQAFHHQPEYFIEFIINFPHSASPMLSTLCAAVRPIMMMLALLLDIDVVIAVGAAFTLNVNDTRIDVSLKMEILIFNLPL